MHACMHACMGSAGVIASSQASVAGLRRGFPEAANQFINYHMRWLLHCEVTGSDLDSATIDLIINAGSQGVCRASPGYYLNLH